MFGNKLINKIFWYIFWVLIVCSVVFIYVRVFILKDYFLVKEVSCDYSLESCFERENEECSGVDEKCDNTIEYYKIIHKKAFNVRECRLDGVDILECGMSCYSFENNNECYYEYNL